jgi:alpha-D-ribose 1-methylphosphonate 5-phosphate C-P lyase
MQVLGYYLRTGHDRFHPHPFQFMLYDTIINICSSKNVLRNTKLNHDAGGRVTLNLFLICDLVNALHEWLKAYQNR